MCVCVCACVRVCVRACVCVIHTYMYMYHIVLSKHPWVLGIHRPKIEGGYLHEDGRLLCTIRYVCGVKCA